MRHSVAIDWDLNIIDLNFGLEDVKGDTFLLNVIINGVDFTGYKIRCELTDGSIRKQYANLLAGGSDDNIVAIDAESSANAFRVVIPAGDTENFSRYAQLDIEVEDEDGLVFTILKQQVHFFDENIDWSIPA